MHKITNFFLSHSKTLKYTTTKKGQKTHYQKCKASNNFIPPTWIITKVQKYFRFKSSPNKWMTKDYELKCYLVDLFFTAN